MNTCHRPKTFLQTVRLEPERPGRTLERNPTLPINEVQPIWPSRISGFHRIANVVNQRGNMNPQLPYATFCDRAPLHKRLGIGEQHVLANVDRHLPGIARVRLTNVDDEKRDAIFVLVVQTVERGNLPAKGRSSVAAEDQHYGPLASERR